MRKILLFIATVASGLAVAFSNVYAADESSDADQIDQMAADDAMVEEIIVTGIKGSMMKAQDIKMESDSILDAIVAEDIGKLPDLTAAESIARIAGVQVTRYNDEADSVLIRGLPDVTTTYNGREFFTAELRRAQLQDFPSQALAGIEVYKSGTADLIEPGLAGLVNVRTRRPFDFEEQVIAGALHYGYNDQSEKSSPAGNILYSNRWNTDSGEFGFLGNVTYAASEYYNGARYNNTWFPTAEPWWNIEAPYEAGGFVLPASVGLYNASGKRWRPSANMALQWRPNDNVEVYFDGIFQGFRGEGMVDNFWFPMTEWNWLTGPPWDVTLTNIVMVDGTDDGQVASLTKTDGIAPQAWRSTNENQTDTFQYAIGVVWDKGPVHVVSDLAYTDSEYSDYAWSFDTGLSFSPVVNVDFFGDEGGATFDAPAWDQTDLSTYQMRGYYESLYEVGGDGLQWRTDFTIDTGWGDKLHTLQAGFRVNDREAWMQRGDRYAWFWDVGVPFTDIGFLDYELTHDPIRSNAQGFTQWMQPTRESIVNNAAALRDFARQNLALSWDAWRLADWESEEVAINPDNDWLAEEQSYAAYLQAKSHFELGSVGLDLFAGVRVVKTDSTTHGTSRVRFDGVETLEPRTVSNSYVDVLPNISVRAMLTDKLQLRAGFTQTVTKPNFGDLNPALNIDQVVRGGVTNPNAPPELVDEVDAYGSGGNPDLKSLTSDNYDISLEYYFADTGYASAAVFYRDLWGFTNWFQRDIETPDYGTVRLNRPENTGEGRIKGWELNVSTFLDFASMPEWLHSFGFSANVTRLEGENRLPNYDPDTRDFDGTFGDFAPIPGLSKYTYNAAVFYERDKFSSRLSYNRRESWVNWYGASTEGEFAGNKTYARDRLDWSASFHLSDNIGIWADVANIEAKPFHNYTAVNGLNYTQDIRDEGRYFGLGVRMDF